MGCSHPWPRNVPLENGHPQHQARTPCLLFLCSTEAVSDEPAIGFSVTALALRLLPSAKGEGTLQASLFKSYFITSKTLTEDKTTLSHKPDTGFLMVFFIVSSQAWLIEVKGFKGETLTLCPFPEEFIIISSIIRSQHWTGVE